MYDLEGKKIEKKCAICLSELEKNVAILPCKHRFCLDCILSWWTSNPSCPFCREVFQFITDYSGKKMTLKDFPKKSLPRQEKTPKCEDCWADIGTEKMRICIECRCVYLHERCLNPEEMKIRGWRC